MATDLAATKIAKAKNAKVKMIPRSICYLLCIISTPSIGTSSREYRLKEAVSPLQQWGEC
jgi:hypothetical protein